MTFRDALQEAWAVASGRPVVPDQIRTYRVMGASHDARGALTSAGDVGLMMTLAPGEQLVPSARLQVGRGGVLEAEVSSYREQGAAVRALAIWCRDPALRLPFLAFCDSLLEHASTGMAVSRALDMCHDEFVRLLAAPALMDFRMLSGLLGELLVLAELVEIDPTAATAWAGRDRERNDFRRNVVALEVKTASRAKSSTLKVHISSIDQLIPPEGGRLFLHAIHLERSDVGGISLVSLVARIRRCVTGLARDHFEEGLASYTVDAADTRTFAPLTRSTFSVAPGFPCLIPERLIAGRLDPGVIGVEYDLDLGSAEPYSVEWKQSIAELLTGVRQ